MPAAKISASTARTIHPPVIIEIDGIEYPVRISYPIFERLRELEKMYRSAAAAEIEAAISMKAEAMGSRAFDIIFVLYDELELMTAAPREIVRALDFNDVKALVEFVMDKYSPNKAQAQAPEPEPAKPVTPEEAEKNGLKAGDSPSP